MIQTYYPGYRILMTINLLIFSSSHPFLNYSFIQLLILKNASWVSKLQPKDQIQHTIWFCMACQLKIDFTFQQSERKSKGTQRFVIYENYIKFKLPLQVTVSSSLKGRGQLEIFFCSFLSLDHSLREHEGTNADRAREFQDSLHHIKW